MTDNVFWQAGQITPEDRERQGGHRGACVWLTGLSAAGKSTIAFALERQLYERGVRSFVLDGDNLRHGLCADLGFSREDREENIRRVGEVARLFVSAGLIAIAAFISPRRAMRDEVRARMPEGRFLEVWVRCPLEVCEQRDPKGLYARARAGQVRDFTGIDAPYESPGAPELVLDTAASAPEQCAARIVAELEARELL